MKKTGEKENVDLAKKLFPKLRIFAPVVVRGEEDRGVRFYEFGKMVYQELLGVMADEDYGDITDIQKGRDITVEVIPAAETGKMFMSTCVDCPWIDHVYHFKSVKEIEDMVGDSGFKIIDKLILPVEDRPMEEIVKNKITINYCALLQKK